MRTTPLVMATMWEYLLFSPGCLFIVPRGGFHKMLNGQPLGAPRCRFTGPDDSTPHLLH